MTVEEFKDFCIHQHDIICNQKYDSTLPYSFHLKAVAKQFEKFSYLLPEDALEICEAACYGHELIEDGRMTYNDIVDCRVTRHIGDYYHVIAEDVAEIVYLCTDFKGRTRKERKQEQLYLELQKNKLAVFVKLCDIIANSKYSLLQNSGMFNKYKSEHYEKVRYYLYLEEYKPMFDYLEQLYEIL